MRLVCLMKVIVAEDIRFLLKIAGLVAFRMKSKRKGFPVLMRQDVWIRVGLVWRIRQSVVEPMKLLMESVGLPMDVLRIKGIK